MEYPLCEQTVTVYRLCDGTVQRQVFPGCYFRREMHCAQDTQGLRKSRSFLLVLPGENPIYPGDRIYDGEGPAVTPAEWPDFTPEKVPGLVVAQYVKPFHWMGKLCHFEAG